MFNKFPKLKYLRGDIYTGRVVIEEKLDGANAGIILNPAGLLQTHSRNRILWTEGERGQHRSLFIGEFLADALKKGGMPTVDTGALRKLVQQRTKRQLTEMNYL